MFAELDRLIESNQACYCIDCFIIARTDQGRDASVNE